MKPLTLALSPQGSGDRRGSLSLEAEGQGGGSVTRGGAR